MVLLIGWVVVLQAPRRSIGVTGAGLALAVCGGLIWLVVELSRRLTGQIDTDQVG